MARSLLANAQAFTFKGQELFGDTEGWTDDLPIRLAQYEYLKRDGGEQEPMGAGVKTFSFSCVFMGADCGRRYQALAASVQQDPRGPLVHPRLGTFQVACRGIRGKETPSSAIDVIEFTIEFVENKVDQTIDSNGQFGAQFRASQAADAAQDALDSINAILANRIANAVYAAAVNAAVELQAWVNKFTEQAIISAQNDLPDPALEKLLANVLSKRNVAVAAFEATLPITLRPPVSLTDAKTAAYIAYAASVQLYQDVVASKPQIVDFTVPSTMTLNQVLVRLYGAEAQDRKSNIKTLNRMATPYAISQGTVLRVVAPVVQQ